MTIKCYYVICLPDVVVDVDVVPKLVLIVVVDIVVVPKLVPIVVVEVVVGDVVVVPKLVLIVVVEVAVVVVGGLIHYKLLQI